MTTALKILALAGSARQGSFNQMLVDICAEMLRQKGMEVTVLHPQDFDIPLYNQDIEAQGMPEAVIRLKALFATHQGLLIASPEYNSSLTPLLVNYIAWLSRQAPGEAPLVSFRGKVAAIMSASQGALGGIRGLPHLRHILSNIGVIVLPDQLALGQCHERLVNGSLQGEREQKLCDTMLQGLVNACQSFFPGKN